jgi:hypothetical protein
MTIGIGDVVGESHARPSNACSAERRERYARDARAAALMRPWTQEIAMQQAWEAALGLDGEQGDAAGA